MTKRRIILLFIVVVLLVSFLRRDRIKLYFENERYYSILSLLHITKPHYKPYKSFYEIFKQEGFDYRQENAKVIEDSLAKLENINPQNQAIIPSITHQVYFTNLKNPKNLSPFYTENLRNSFNQLNELAAWEHNIWTNYPDLFPDDIKTIKNVKIRDITELENHQLYNLLKKTVDKGGKDRAYYAAASDYTRLMVLQQYGGIYRDMDYEIYNPTKLFELMKSFDYIGARERVSIKSYYANAFIAAKPNHPIINEAVRLLYRNHHLGENDPIYLKYPSIEFDRIYFNGPPLITIAYFAKNNISNNRDIILPPWMIFNKAFAEFKNNGCNFNKMTLAEVVEKNNNLAQLITDFTEHSKDLTPYDGKIELSEDNIYYNTKYRSGYPIIGADMSCGTWVPDNGFKKIYYWNIPFLRK